jgi:hypothetical protein
MLMLLGIGSRHLDNEFLLLEIQRRFGCISRLPVMFHRIISERRFRRKAPHIWIGFRNIPDIPKN